MYFQREARNSHLPFFSVKSHFYFIFQPVWSFQIYIKMSEIDELFDLKNSYYLGNFSHTVNEANKLKLSKLKFLDIFHVIIFLKLVKLERKLSKEMSIFTVQWLVKNNSAFSMLKLNHLQHLNCLLWKPLPHFCHLETLPIAWNYSVRIFISKINRISIAYFRFPTSSSCTRKLGEPSDVCCYSFAREELRKCS